MTDRTYDLDMTIMFAVHDALRRELGHLARVTARPEDDPKHILRTAAGWEMFTSFLRVHHTAEDVAVWGVVEQVLAERPGGDRAVLDAMETEHAAIDPLIEAVDAALADRETGPQVLGDLVDALATSLGAHLRHEEEAGLPLIEATLTPQQWKGFGEDHRARIGPDARRYLPWILDEASPKTLAGMIGKTPAPLLEAYETEWRQAYVDLDRWSARPAP